MASGPTARTFTRSCCESKPPTAVIAVAVDVAVDADVDVDVDVAVATERVVNAKLSVVADDGSAAAKDLDDADDDDDDDAASTTVDGRGNTRRGDDDGATDRNSGFGVLNVVDSGGAKFEIATGDALVSICSQE
jgi:hypothetical protein